MLGENTELFQPRRHLKGRAAFTMWSHTQTDEEVTVYPSEKGWREKQSFIVWYWKPVKVMCFSFCSVFFLCGGRREMSYYLPFNSFGQIRLLFPFDIYKHVIFVPNLYSSEPIRSPKGQYYTWEVTIIWPKDIINQCSQMFQPHYSCCWYFLSYHLSYMFNFFQKQWMESKMNDYPSPSHHKFCIINKDRIYNREKEQQKQLNSTQFYFFG